MEFYYNTSFQSSLKMTPFQVIYGRASPALISYNPGVAKVVAVDW